MMRHKVKTLLLILLVLILFEAATIPWFSIADLKHENPAVTSLMRQRLREAEEEGKTLNIAQHWIPLAQIPHHLIDAVVVAEDGTFFTHGGVDWFEVQESIEKNMREKRAARGASTITQQLAKNLFLSTSKDPVRKLKEFIITLMLERMLTKDRILEIYLNIIEWGRGIFGIEAAARTYFGKSAGALSLEESIRLAAVIPSPLKHRPDVDSRYVLRRKEIMLNRMEARGFADQPHAKETLTNPTLTPELRSPEADSSSGVISSDSTETDEGDGNGL
jgi:monofunctional biosynthetic peptidoglycan transglycosylase